MVEKTPGDAMRRSADSASRKVTGGFSVSQMATFPAIWRIGNRSIKPTDSTPRQRSDFFPKLLKELNLVTFLLIVIGGQGNRRGEQVFYSKSWVDSTQLGIAAQEKSGSCQEDHGQSDLEYDQGAPKADSAS